MVDRYKGDQKVFLKNAYSFFLKKKIYFGIVSFAGQCHCCVYENI